MKKNKTQTAPEQEKMDLPGLGENENEKTVKPENRPLEEPKSYEEAIEAILFAAGHPVSYETLAKTFDMPSPIIRRTVKEYAEKYNHSKLPRGVILLALDDECQLCTKAEYLAYIRFALGIRRNGTLSASTLETLAIVAYHQPVTRAYVDAVRGVDSSYAVSSLVERGLIEAKGRLDAPGRPVLFVPALFRSRFDRRPSQPPERGDRRGIPDRAGSDGRGGGDRPEPADDRGRGGESRG